MSQCLTSPRLLPGPSCSLSPPRTASARSCPCTCGWFRLETSPATSPVFTLPVKPSAPVSPVLPPLLPFLPKLLCVWGNFPCGQ